MVNGVNARARFGRDRSTRRLDSCDVRRFEMGIDHDDIRTGNTGQSAQHPFEIRTEWFRGNRRRAGKGAANKRDAIRNWRRNPCIHAYRGESISRSLGGSLGNNDIGIESQMRSMRFDGSHRQQDDRVVADAFGDFGPAQGRQQASMVVRNGYHVTVLDFALNGRSRWQFRIWTATQ